MNERAIVLATGLAFAAALAATTVRAQNARSFVSGHGLDSNACTLAAPCRTFAAAYAVTNAAGEIDVLDPAGYGSVTINHAISIVNDGVGTSSILVPTGGNGVTINAPTTDAVSLRGLTTEGAGVGQVGIVFFAGKSLTIENCTIRHVTTNGIQFVPNSTSNLAVSSTLVADNTNEGIVVDPTGAGTVTAVFNRVEANDNGNSGIIVNGSSSTGTVSATVSESVAAHNGGAGFAALSFSGQAPTTLMLFHSVSANNTSGLVASSAIATLRAAQSMVTGNTNGWTVTSSGVIQSYADNYIDGNVGNETAPTGTAKK